MKTYSTYLSVSKSSSYMPSNACLLPLALGFFPSTSYIVSSSISSSFLISEYLVPFLFYTPDFLAASSDDSILVAILSIQLIRYTYKSRLWKLNLIKKKIEKKIKFN